MKFSIKDFFTKCDQIRSYHIYWRSFSWKTFFCRILPNIHEGSAYKND